ncbi:MAG: nucleoside-diphosphate kinase [Holosporales bacterium]|jgi:nucleoside-diphosphate kinase|nr:nucleoside-diphosphate kinase [Holosporales bacterium]
MANERTLSILKPDATARNITGKINTKFEAAGLRIVAQRRVHLARSEAEQFYAIHKGKAFFNDLCAFMSSAPVVVQVLEGANAIAKNREVMGATDPKQAAPGTIRAEFGLSIDQNTVHGSDSATTAAQEIAFFFRETEILS